MPKERPKDKRIKKLKQFTMITIIVILIIAVLGFIRENARLTEFDTLVNLDNTPADDLDKVIIYNIFLNEINKIQPFVFIDVLTASDTKAGFISVELNRLSSGGVSYYSGGSQKAGLTCDFGQAVRYLKCDSASRSTCTTDLFANYWQVKTGLGDYLDFGNYYTKDMDFYYSYDCYSLPVEYFVSSAVQDVEKRYLYNNNCVDYNSLPSSASYNEYATELKCLEALDEILTLQNQESCQVSTTNICSGDRLYQKSVSSSCDVTSTLVQICSYGCDGNRCASAQEITCTDKSLGQEKCESGYVQELRQDRYCNEYWEIIDTCDVQTTSPTTTTTEPDTTTTPDDTTPESTSFENTTVTTTTSTNETLQCLPYQELSQETLECEVKAENLFSNEGIKSFVDENTELVIGSVVVVILMLGVIFY